jgi:hypothetical protein
MEEANKSRRRLSFDPSDIENRLPTANEIVIDYKLPKASTPSSFGQSKRKFEETEEKEIAESQHKREVLLKGRSPPSPTSYARNP